MKESMIQEAIALYDERGDESIEEINRIMNQWEYTNGVNELRKAEKLFSRLVNHYSSSPEEILLKKEEQEKILHFLLWVKRFLQTQSEEDWQLWRAWIIEGIKPKELAYLFHIPYSSIHNRLNRITRDVQGVIHLYDEEFGSLQVYLED